MSSYPLRHKTEHLPIRNWIKTGFNCTINILIACLKFLPVLLLIFTLILFVY